MTFSNIFVVISICFATQISIAANSDNDAAYTAEEVHQSINALRNLDFVDFETGTLAGGNRMFGLFPEVNKAVEDQSLSSTEDSDLEKLSALYAQPRHSCIASLLISYNDVFTRFEAQFRRIIEMNYAREVKEAQEAVEFKNAYEAQGHKYYGRDTEPSPRGIYIDLSIIASADLWDLYTRLGNILDARSIDKKDVSGGNSDSSSPEIENTGGIDINAIDVYEKPLLLGGIWGERDPYRLKWYFEALAERSQYRGYDWEFEFDPNNRRKTVSCEIDPLRLAHKLGMDHNNVLAGDLDELLEEVSINRDI